MPYKLRLMCKEFEEIEKPLKGMNSLFVVFLDFDL